MKIALICFSSRHDTFSLLKIMEQYAEEIILLIPLNYELDSYFKNKYQVYYFRPFDPIGLINNVKSAGAIIDIIKILKKKKVNKVHFHSTRTFWLFPLILYIKTIMQMKIIITIHEFAERSGDSSSSLKQYYEVEYFVENRFADYLYFGGNNIMESFRKSRKTKAKLIPGTLGAFDFFKRYTTNAIRKYNQILFCGRIEKYKGLDVLIESLKYVKHDFNLIIAGRGNILKNSHFSSLESENKIIVLNEFIDDIKLFNLIASSAVVVTPYLSGTQSGIISLSLGLMTPVISTNVGSIYEIIKDSETGFIIPKKNPYKIAEKLNIILNNSTLQKDFEKNIDKYNHIINEKMKNQLFSIYFT